MAKAAITKRTVDAAKATGRDYFIWDPDVAGFGLKVTAAGGKTYVFQYRLARPGEAERTPARRYTIGRHGRLTPDQARKRAKELAALVEQGIDPRQQELDAIETSDRKAEAAAELARLEGELLFERIADLWLDHYEHEKGRRPASVRQAKLVVDNHLKPALKGKPMPHIGRDELEPIIDAIPAKQKAMRRTVHVYASVLFGWAAKKRYAPANPLTGMEKPAAPKPRNRVLDNLELAQVWAAAANSSAPFDSFFRLLILTGQRRSEVAGMEWAELDRSSATWTIRADRAKNGVAQLVPLSPAAIAEIDRLAVAAIDDPKEGAKKWPKTGFALTTTKVSPISGIGKAKRSLDEQITKDADGRVMAPWRIHDLRRTLATGLQQLGVRFEVTEAVLNHVSGAKGGVAGIYQLHDWKEEKRAALEAWGRHVAAITTNQTPDNVVPIGAATKSA